MAQIKFTSKDAAVPGQKDATKQAQDAPGQQAAKAKADAKGGKGVKSGSNAKAKKEAPSVFGSAEDTNDYGPDYGYKKIRFHKDDEVNPYAKMQDQRHAMDPRKRIVITLGIVLVAVFIVVCILPTDVFFGFGFKRSLAEYLQEMTSAAGGLLYFFTGGESLYTTYIWTIVVAALAGAALGLTGGVYQGAMKNALASPSTLGVMQGGQLGMIIYLVFFYTNSYTGSASGYDAYLAEIGPLGYLREIFGSYLCSLFGCFFVVALIMLMAYIAGRGRLSNVSLIIAGQVFASIATVIMTWIRYYVQMTTSNEEVVSLMQQAQTMTFQGSYNLFTVATFAIPLLLCMAIVFANSGKMSLLAFNEEEARSMGISTRFTRNLMVGLCTALTALVVAFCGPIGFIGFLVPHMTRKLIGAEFKYLLPASALLGAIIVVVVTYLTQLNFPGVPAGSTGFFTSVIGCVTFLVMALRQRGKSNGEWI